MSKKPKRGAPAIDMTAMVDVAFLLLTFFILTTTSFREESKVEVDTPSSVSNLEVPDTKLCVISVDLDGKVFVGYTDIGTRVEVLRRFVQEQNDRNEAGIELNEDAQNYFSNLQEFGVGHKNFKRWLNEDNEIPRDEFPHDGISPIVTDSTNMSGNELKDWIRWGRLADQRMRFAIKGDVEASYETVAHIIASLQEWDVNQFSLITALEEGGIAEIVEEGGSEE
ncbi:MAG: biopolymer transporter ExbD [Bacteroidota bacterium]